MRVIGSEFRERKQYLFASLSKNSWLFFKIPKKYRLGSFYILHLKLLALIFYNTKSWSYPRHSTIMCLELLKKVLFTLHFLQEMVISFLCWFPRVFLSVCRSDYLLENRVIWDKIKLERPVHPNVSAYEHQCTQAIRTL